MKAWREGGYEPASSILIGVSTLSELELMVREMGLPPAECAVLTADDAMNALGVSSELHGETRVLFTTQAMIRSRTKGRTFAASEDFHFDGQPRALRLWDESILPSAGVTLSRTDLFSLIEPLRRSLPSFVDALEDFATSLRTVPDGSIIDVPPALTLERGDMRTARMALRIDGQRDLLDRIQLMAGAAMTLRDYGTYEGRVLIGSSQTLPDDFAPLVAVDASARVRATYQLWKEHRGSLVELPSAGHSFHNLNVQIWDKPTGKAALREAGPRAEIAEGIAELIKERDPKGAWLIVSYKGSLQELEADVLKAMGKGNGLDLRMLHWGRHTATNEHKDVDNVIIVGQHTYEDSSYDALTLAASGLSVAAANPIDRRTIKAGEHKHHLLQAICRGSVRKPTRGGTTPCNAFLVTSIPGVDAMIEHVFPGCSISRWQSRRRQPRYLQPAMRFVQDRIDQGWPSDIRKADLRGAIGMTNASDLKKNVLSKPEFIAMLAANGIENSGQVLRKAVSLFEAPEAASVESLNLQASVIWVVDRRLDLT